MPLAIVMVNEPLMNRAATVRLTVMVTLQTPLGPFATHRLSVADLLPRARWPLQIEIHAGNGGDGCASFRRR